MQFLRSADVDGAVIVTTPQEVALLDVRKELNFAAKVKKHKNKGKLRVTTKMGKIHKDLALQRG